ncbi:RNA polymerase II transcription factor B subunit 5 [Metschnikowia bicuspidata var. bicuspidata NRRL YB-4993]|uniref:General transcription and DNA repair factor IIH subunit TFB5 n=1 Tax=Metschnikowia bicuspidata var. bicuspidata NRRL YB-4993 TaxID=869754 RepID=A0A1A0H8B4_9ASCO|nr:RNA polymerase II transcription factor B subunit 5 [Metschnikowia bicuspidata var. bicuspidata NRRL YB-4993]OBA20133.1 RNA polymerase II transcription factor B subunit 5 [Metschnikowia bicuspidata var. bicuspidata NRRL YB-4993]
MPTASKGVLVRCDPSIRALILQIDSTSRGIVLQELDNSHLMIKGDMVQFVKNELNRLLLKNIYEPADGEKQP